MSDFPVLGESHWKELLVISAFFIGAFTLGWCIGDHIYRYFH